MYTLEELENMFDNDEADLVIDQADFKVFKVAGEYLYNDGEETFEIELLGEVPLENSDGLEIEEDDLISGKLEKYGFDDYSDYEVAGMSSGYNAEPDGSFMYFYFK
jgi:hypothetical protein